LHAKVNQPNKTWSKVDKRGGELLKILWDITKVAYKGQKWKYV